MVSTRWVIPWVLLALWTGTGRVHAMVVDQWAPFTQPDSTTFAAHVFGDEFEINWVTGDGYAFVHNPADGYLYYAELDSQGDFRASNAKVGIDDPAAHGIAPHLQRSAKRRAALQAERVASGYIKDPKRQASGGRHGDPTHVPCTGTSPCDVYVVMVSFVDASSGSYANYDQPWGYSMAQFNQFFNGGS